MAPKSASAPRPYYEEAREPSPEWRAELARLVGFEVDELRTRLHAWLFANAFELRSDDGDYSGLSFVPDDVDETSPKPLQKAKAIWDTLVRLVSLERMWGPERVAWFRWKRTLEALEKALLASAPFANVRAQEDSYFLGHCTGEHARTRYSEVLEASRAVGDGIRTLLEASLRAGTMIPAYKDDLLPGVRDTGRWGKAYLASIEAQLNEAGFAYPELATITDPAKGGEQRVRQRVERYRRTRPSSEEG